MMLKSSFTVTFIFKKNHNERSKPLGFENKEGQSQNGRKGISEEMIRALKILVQSTRGMNNACINNKEHPVI